MAPRRIRILIVDDSAVMRSLLRSVISADAGLEVAGTAADGAAALDCIESLLPDLVLLDVEMPVMDGLTTLRELRKRGYRMPVVMCSALTQRGAKVTLEALACGASDYVAKPSGQPDREQATLALAQDLTPRIHALAAPLQVPPGDLPVGLPSPILLRPGAAVAAAADFRDCFCFGDRGIVLGARRRWTCCCRRCRASLRCRCWSCSTCRSFLPGCLPSG